MYHHRLNIQAMPLAHLVIITHRYRREMRLLVVLL